MLTKLLLTEGLSRESVVSARYLLAVLLLLPFGLPNMGRRRPSAPPRRRDWVALFLVGALGSGIGALLFTAALEYSSAGVANSISKTAPIFVAFFGYLTLRERVTSTRLLLVGAMVGADVLIGLGELSFAAEEARARLIGDGLALLAGITRATAEILAKGALIRFSPSTVTLWRFGAGFCVTGAVAVTTGAYTELLQLDARTMVLLGLLAAVSTALSMYLYYKGTALIPVHVAVSLKILGAVVTAIVSWIMLQETLNLYHVAGMGVLISGAYLLVMRTAREGMIPESTLDSVYSRAAPAPTGRLRVRLTLFITSVTLAIVLVATVLSIRHTNATVRRQIRLTMGKVAAVIVQLTGVEDPPPRHMLQQYLDLVVRHRIEREVYSVDIVYITVTDGAGNVLAFAVNSQMSLVDVAGRELRSADTRAAQRLLAMSATGELSRKYDLIPVRAELRRPDSPSAPRSVVEIGCKRSIANQVLAEIAVRNVVLVLILLAIGIALAASWVRRMTNPLEKIAAAMQRLSGGELDLPLYSEGRGEVRQMGDSLQALRDGLRMGGALRRALGSYAASQINRDLAPEAAAVEPEPQEVALLLVEVPHALLADVPQGGTEVRQFVDTVVAAVIDNDGEIDGYLDGYLAAFWLEGGQESALWAAMTALELRSALETRFASLDAEAHAHIGVEMTALRVGQAGILQADLRRVHAETLRKVSQIRDGVRVFVTQEVVGSIGDHLVCERLAGLAIWRLDGVAAGPDLAGMADVADD